MWKRDSKKTMMARSARRRTSSFDEADPTLVFARNKLDRRNDELRTTNLWNGRRRRGFKGAEVVLDSLRLLIGDRRVTLLRSPVIMTTRRRKKVSDISVVSHARERFKESISSAIG